MLNNNMEVGLSGIRLNPILFSVIIPIILIVAFLLWRSTKTDQAQPPEQLKCRRIKDIPIETTKKDLEHLLKTCLPEESYHSLTLVRSTSQDCMATLNSKKIPNSFRYRIDESFFGVTPVFGSEEACIE